MQWHRRLVPKSQGDPDFWRSDVPQLSMDLWKSYFQVPHETRVVPFPPIVAFYESLTTSSTLPNNPEDDSTSAVKPKMAPNATDGRNLQRIYIRSPYIAQELEALSPSGLPKPIM
jgi:hypothetical protein